MKKRVVMSFGVLLVLSLQAVGDQSDKTPDQTPAAQHPAIHKHTETGQPKKRPGHEKGPSKTKTKAPSTDTTVAAPALATETSSAPVSGASNATGTTTDSSQAGVNQNTAATSGGTAATGETNTVVTDTMVANPAEHSLSSDRMFVALLIVGGVNLVAVLALLFETRKRFAGLKSRLEKLEYIESAVASVVRDLSPLAGTPPRVIKLHEVAEGISKDMTGLRNDVAELKKRPKTTDGGGDRERSSHPTTESYEAAPPVERDDESIHDVLRQVASDCVQSPITQSQARARVGRGWEVSSFGTGELPDAFIVDTGRGDAWFMPNTRRWSALRGEGLFDVAGPDLPTARIIRIDSLPRVRRSGSVIQLASGKRGRLEISIA